MIAIEDYQKILKLHVLEIMLSETCDWIVLKHVRHHVSDKVIWDWVVLTLSNVIISPDQTKTCEHGK